MIEVAQERAVPRFDLRPEGSARSVWGDSSAGWFVGVRIQRFVLLMSRAYEKGFIPIGAVARSEAILSSRITHREVGEEMRVIPRIHPRLHHDERAATSCGHD